jgi:hypothetical protein
MVAYREQITDVKELWGNTKRQLTADLEPLPPPEGEPQKQCNLGTE